jgi:hypothetical protein
MIETIADFPGNVVALRAKGRVTAEDYRATVIPAIETMLKEHERARLYFEFGYLFHGMDVGALLEDFWVGIRTSPYWERVAVVSDVAWIREAISIFAILVPGTVKVFLMSETLLARTWIAQPENEVG